MPLKVSFKSSLVEKFNIFSVIAIIFILPAFVFTSFKTIDNTNHQKVLGASSVSLDPTNDNSEIIAKNLDTSSNLAKENADSIKFIIFAGAFTIGVSIFLITLLVNHLKNTSKIKQEGA